jgi:hypothetical protein
MNNQFQLHRILTAFGVFMLGFQTMSLDFSNFSSETNKTPFLLMFFALVSIGVGMYLQRKNQ